MRKINKVVYIALMSVFLASCSTFPKNSLDSISADSNTSFNDTTSSSETSLESSSSYIESSTSSSLIDSSTTEDTTSSSSSSIDSSYYKLNNVRFDSYDVQKASGLSSIPSRGKPNILVVPVNFKDNTSFTSNDLKVINSTFNGTNEDHSNNYWESVKSFYLKSSFNRLDLNFVISDVFTPTIMTASDFMSSDDDYGSASIALLKDVYLNAKINNKKIDYNDFDTDEDGFVDGVWLIYNEKSQYSGSNYWPYCYWTNQDIIDNTGKIPIFGVYANCAMSFMYEDSRDGLDAHTFIHETGHMLGFDDYYTYDDGISQSSTGGYDMMDFNIGDHGSFSKLMAGWINPYVVSSNTTLTINPYATTGDAIIISNDFNDSAFSEYIIIDFYTPDGLYSLDANNFYPSRPLYFTESGIRIYYVDSRLIKADYRYGNIYNYEYLQSNVEDLSYLTLVSHSNSLSMSYINMLEGINDEFLYSFIAKNHNSNLYNNSSFSLFDYRTYLPDNDALFKEGDVFNAERYSNLFKNGSEFHDGSIINFEISIDKITSIDATISISFN